MSEDPTVHSDWGDWLPNDIASAIPDGVRVWYLGRNGFVLKAADGTTVRIGPYFGTGDPPRTIRMIPVPFEPADVQAADAILATHEHVDHVHGPSQAPILSATGAAFYGPNESVAAAREDECWPEAYGVDPNQLVTVAEEETITVEPANDPDTEHPVTYVVEHGAGTFFHGGDKPADALADVGQRYDIDLGVLAYGTKGMMLDRETPGSDEVVQRGERTGDGSERARAGSAAPESLRHVEAGDRRPDGVARPRQELRVLVRTRTRRNRRRRVGLTRRLGTGEGPHQQLFFQMLP